MASKSNSASKARLKKAKLQAAEFAHSAHRPGATFGYNLTSKDKQREELALCITKYQGTVSVIKSGTRKFEEHIWRKGRRAELTW